MSDMPLLPVIVRLTSAVNRAFRPGLILASLVALLAVVWSGSSQPALLRAPGPVQRVLVITLDGMRPDALLQTNAPSITALAARGAASWAAKTVLPAVTLPAHASILTGLDVSEHGLDHNNSIYPCTSIPAPTFITLARDAGYRTAMVVGKERMCQFLQRDDVNYTFARAGDGSVADRVIQLLEEDYQVIFAHFPNPDFFGHLTGWMSEPYLFNVAATDAQIGRILDALDRVGATDSTLIILTADHGGHGFEHGDDTPEDRNVPWIIAGPGVPPGLSLGDEISVADTAPTVLWALGLPPVPSELGRARTDVFNAAFVEAMTPDE